MPLSRASTRGRYSRIVGVTSSSGLDSPYVMSKLATPKPATAMNSDVSHVIDDATSAMHDTYDETTSMLDTTMPLGEFLDERVARARENEIIENEIIEGSDCRCQNQRISGRGSRTMRLGGW